ncbi:MAG: enolase C-terminal domain-like protein [Acidimicrobiia bacterium]
MRESSVPIERIGVSAYTVPTDGPESDGTLEWDSTTMVLVEASGGGMAGLGYSYTHEAAASLASSLLADVVEGHDVMDVPGRWHDMVHAIRNLGRPGLASSAIAAVDNALWDLKARLLGMPLSKLLGMVRQSVPVYGSGGFTSYDEPRLKEQLGNWAGSGFSRVKMKVGRHPEDDSTRVLAARDAIGPTTGLMVDANGAYRRKQALGMARAFADCGVDWFEEPVTSDDLDGLRMIRDSGPPGMSITAGEYGYDLFYFERMIRSGAVDVVQADATRCAGITGFMRVGALCQAHALPLSSHTAPAQHLHVAAALAGLIHMEYFHDHARIELGLFDGAVAPHRGTLTPDLSRPGIGLELKTADAEQYRVK